MPFDQINMPWKVANEYMGLTLGNISEMQFLGKIAYTVFHKMSILARCNYVQTPVEQDLPKCTD